MSLPLQLVFPAERGTIVFASTPFLFLSLPRWRKFGATTFGITAFGLTTLSTITF